MFAKLCVIFYLLMWECNCLEVLQIKGSYGVPIKQSIDSTKQYIIEFSGVLDVRPLIVQMYSADANPLNPILVMVRQPKAVLSWQVPLAVESETGVTYFFNTSRTLCYEEVSFANKTSGSFKLDDDPIISVSTANEKPANFELLVNHRKDFLVQAGVVYNLEISPSTPMIYFYNFSIKLSNFDKNFDTVFLKTHSEDTICMVASIQNINCPIMDLNQDITTGGFYETIDQRGGMTIPKEKFPDGFYVVFVAKGSDYACTRKSDENAIASRKKTLWFRINPGMSLRDYIVVIFYTLGILGGFSIAFGVGFYFYSRRSHRPRTMVFVNESQLVVTTTPMNIRDIPDEPGYDTLRDIHFDREIFLRKPVIYLSDLARQDPKELTRKAYIYLYNVLTVAVFYGLPVIQLVFTYQYAVNETGQQDLCYYNFLCANPFGFFSDFNHIFSNAGYVMMGALFLVIVRCREVLHVDAEFDREYGIPQHFGLFYAMGVALCMEGVLSASYHVCPCESNFQFDSSFMYVMAILCMVALYQNRHPDINAHAYATFLVLAMAILLGMIGLFHPNVYFMVVFVVIHLMACLYLTLQVYYMGCFKLNKTWFLRTYRLCVYDFRTRYLNVFRPKYRSRMSILISANIINWLLAFFGLFSNVKNFSFFVLLILLANTMLYFFFYICMKLRYRERVKVHSWVFLVLSLTFAVFAMYFFVNKSISWIHPPAESRHYNRDCSLFKFYDYHDIWHFLSAVGMFFMFMVLLTLDDDLSHTHRSRIHVF